MTTAEFSAELDVIYENINKNGAPGLNGYEKSVILTHAQELYVMQMIGANPTAFPHLVNIFTSAPAGSDPFSGGTIFPGTSDGTNKVLAILNEKVVDSDDIEYTILPLDPITYTRKTVTPYKYPPRRRAWRIERMNSSVNTVEIIGRPNITLASYVSRYIKKPRPIILEDLQVLAPFYTDMVDTYSANSDGAGYVEGDILTVTSGTTPSGDATFRVTGVTAMGVTQVVVINRGFDITGGASVPTTTDGLGDDNATLTITTISASTIDGEYAPSVGELDAVHHRNILKLASNLDEQYYYDKYGTNGDQRQD
jgi:hypothetical protein